LYDSYSNCYTIFVYLPPEWFCFVRSGKQMKRESGANPEQSRCCEAPSKRPEHTLATEYEIGKALGRESVRRPAFQQRPLLLVG